MANSQLGSDFYKSVFSEIDNKYTGTMKWKTNSDDSDDSSTDERTAERIQRTGKRNSYKLKRENKNRNRVHWIDEYENCPLASDKRFESDTDAKVCHKSILKYRVNCVIIVSE